MSALPEQYRRYAQPGQQPVRPTVVELYDEADPIVYVPDAYGQLVPMRKSQAPAPVQATPPRDLAPQPLLDPLAQRMAAGGVLAAGVGWGGAQLLNAVAGAGTGLLAFALLLLLARRQPTVSIHQEVHQHARFGKNEVTM